MAKSKPKGTIVVKHAVKRNPNLIYFVDGEGNVRTTKRVGGRKVKRPKAYKCAAPAAPAKAAKRPAKKKTKANRK